MHIILSILIPLTRGGGGGGGGEGGKGWNIKHKQSPAVVIELDDVVVVAVVLSRHYGGE